MTNLRQALIAIEASRIEATLDGLPERFRPANVHARLYELQSGGRCELPAWLVGAACGIPVCQRAGSYILTENDELLTSRGGPVRTGPRSVRQGPVSFLERALPEDQDDDLAA